MSIIINKIRRASVVEWDYIWQNCDYSTYFHSQEWAKIWKGYLKRKMQPDPKLVIFNDNKKALLPLSCEPVLKGMAKRYISSPAGTFGGWISTDNIGYEHVKLLADFLTLKLSNIIWRINPYAPFAIDLNLASARPDITQAINLAADFNIIYKNWTRGNRGAITKSRKMGVNIRIAETQRDWNSYYSIYKDSLQRWKEKATSRYDSDLFQIIYSLHSPYVKLWLASHREAIIGGALCFYSRKHAVYWHGAGLEKYFYLRPINLLLYEIINDAWENKYHWFDFNPSGGHRGVMQFKESFGAKKINCPVFIKESRLLRTYKRLTV